MIHQLIAPPHAESPTTTLADDAVDYAPDPFRPTYSTNSPRQQFTLGHPRSTVFGVKIADVIDVEGLRHLVEIVGSFAFQDCYRRPHLQSALVHGLTLENLGAERLRHPLLGLLSCRDRPRPLKPSTAPRTRHERL